MRAYQIDRIRQAVKLLLPILEEETLGEEEEFRTEVELFRTEVELFLDDELGLDA